MGFLLPVLLLGLAQPAGQSIDLSPQPEQTQAPVPSNPILARKFAFNGAEKQKTGSPFDRIVIHDLPDLPRTGCLTMRSYYFQRRDGHAPEFVGMTTCEPGRNFTTKKVDRPARLVPAN